MGIPKVGKEVVFDLNNDGRPDKITVASECKDLGGRGTSDSIEFIPSLRTKGKSFVPFDRQDSCSIAGRDLKTLIRDIKENGIPWLYTGHEAPFYAKEDKRRKKPFHVGDEVVLDGKKYKIEGFKVLVKSDGEQLTASEAVAVLTGCVTAGLGQLTRQPSRSHS